MSSGYGQNHNSGGHGPAHPNISNGSSHEQGTPASSMGFASPAESAAVDHALLESLFYNEMMMLDSSSPSSSNFLSQHFAGAVQPQQHGKTAIAETDAKTIAEKEMLQDFGVTANSQPFHSAPPSAHAPPPPPQPYYPPPVNAPVGASVRTPPVPVPQYSTTHPQTHTHTQTHPHSAHPHSTTNTPIYPAPVPPPGMVATLAPQSVPIPTQTAVPPPAPQARKPPALTIETPKEPVIPQEKTQKLVDQFATLASRLGIELPNNVLQSLTAAAAKNDPSQEVTKVHSSTKSTNNKTSGSGSGNSSNEDEMASALDVAPTVEELRKTAEEAIAAVTSKKRAVSDEPEDASSSNANRPLYSKRRKKPRLSDCESRLAELKKENELLKRHLQNVSNKALRFDQEKEEAGKRIKRLQEADAGPEEMDKAIKEFSDMYSDYGVNRQQELSFHLEQLQRLANPTNFTKLGLWTLGRDTSDPKRNPIAGILQKELEIVPQQGRKIVEQSEKIRALCENLKECLSLLAKLRSLCEQKTQIFHDRMNKCREILTSKQVVKLIIWINEHTQLLETVCPGWGTEHIHSKTPVAMPSK